MLDATCLHLSDKLPVCRGPA